MLVEQLDIGFVIFWYLHVKLLFKLFPAILRDKRSARDFKLRVLPHMERIHHGNVTGAISQSDVVTRLHGSLNQLCRVPYSLSDSLGSLRLIFLDDFFQIRNDAEELFYAVLPEVVLRLRNLIQVLLALRKLTLENLYLV